MIKVYERRDDTTQITHTDLHGRGNGTLVVAAHCVGNPSNNHRLGDIAAAYEEEEGEVAYTDRNPVLKEEQDIANGSDADSHHGEGVSVSKSIGQPCSSQTANRSHNVDWDGEDLCSLCSVAHFPENSRNEELHNFVSAAAAVTQR